jgi:hypothetical protein
MNQLKRRSSLQRKGFGYDRASMALDVWDSVVSHSGAWTAKWQYFNPSQRLAGLGYPAVMTIPRLCVRYPSYAIENRAVMTKLAV